VTLLDWFILIEGRHLNLINYNLHLEFKFNTTFVKLEKKTNFKDVTFGFEIF